MLLSVAVHSEYENVMPLISFCFHFQKLRGKYRQRDGGREKMAGEEVGGTEGGREGESLLSCCVVPCVCEGAAPPRLSAILLPPPRLPEPALAC